MFWYHKYEQRISGVTAIALKVLGKGIDVVRTASWVRRHDVVIVPGCGVLEASLPMRPWGFPYAMFLLSASGRLFGTKVALVSVGAGAINQPVTRWLFNSAARLAFYRSYRDPGAREAMRRARALTSRETTSTPTWRSRSRPRQMMPGDAQSVGVGVMAYRRYQRRARRSAEEIYASLRRRR